MSMPIDWWQHGWLNELFDEDAWQRITVINVLIKVSMDINNTHGIEQYNWLRKMFEILWLARIIVLNVLTKGVGGHNQHLCLKWILIHYWGKLNIKSDVTNTMMWRDEDGCHWTMYTNWLYERKTILIKNQCDEYDIVIKLTKWGYWWCWRQVSLYGKVVKGKAILGYDGPCGGEGQASGLAPKNQSDGEEWVKA